MHIKDMPAHERPQEKLLYSGVSSLSTAELIALIIRTGNGSKSAVQLAEDVISYASSEAGSLGRVDVKELMSIEGIGVTKACSIVASIELSKRIHETSLSDNRAQITSAEDVAGILIRDLKHERREHLIEFILNAKGEIEAKLTISIGELTATSIHPREVLNPAIKRSASSIIIAHNHPSGDPTPSREDIESTSRMAEAAAIVGIRLLDHVIIGDNCYISMRRQGLMP